MVRAESFDDALEQMLDEMLELAKEHIEMTICNFYVTRASRSGWDSDYQDTLENATNKARSMAWKEGEDCHIFQRIATASKPESVNDVKVTTLS